ncbi:hypothetical protein JL720_13897 [Aureococcus anophagefferens]|nr:hypothetical protein JL720_13897 [Aureococcus anophagefferens]
MGCHRAAPAALAFVAGIFAAVVVFQAQHVTRCASSRADQRAAYARNVGARRRAAAAAARRCAGLRRRAAGRKIDGAPAVLNRHVFYDGDRTAPPLAPAAPPARAGADRRSGTPGLAARELGRVGVLGRGASSSAPRKREDLARRGRRRARGRRRDAPRAAQAAAGPARRHPRQPPPRARESRGAGPPPGATAGPRTQVSRCVSRFYYERDARGTVAADVALRVEINQ